MNNSYTILLWKKILMTICMVVSITCTIIVGNLKKIINYDYESVKEWDYRKLSHFGDVRHTNELDENRVHFGGREWYSNEITNGIKTDKDYGTLVRLYSYYDNGENVDLWVYDIKPKLEELNISRDSFYINIYKEYSSDTTKIWKISRDFRPFLALTSGPLLYISGEESEFREYIIVFANDRVYSFCISNDKLKSDGQTNVFNVFDERCVNIVKDIDFNTYRKWETDYNKYKTLSLKEHTERLKWCRILLTIVLFCSVLFLAMPQQRLGKVNMRARNLFFYDAICYCITLLICSGLIWIGDTLSETMTVNMGWAFGFIAATIIYTILMTYLTRRSNEVYHNTFLIPSWMIKTFNINFAVGKRILLVLLFFPLYYIVPIPFVGIVYVFTLYVIPIMILIAIVLIIKWIIDGKRNEIDRIKATGSNGINKMFCRHCGSQIDSDSEYCRYCGKKV